MTGQATQPRVRVIHVTTVPASLRFLRGQAPYMRRHGFELEAISSPGAGLEEHGEREGIAVHGVAMSRRISPLEDLAALVRLVRHVRRRQPDIVHAHTPKGGLLGTLAAALAGVPVRIYHMRGLRLMGASGSTAFLLSLAERVCCAAATDVLCVSHSVRDIVVERGLCSATKIRVLADGSGQGVDATGRFDPSRLEPDARVRTRRWLGVAPRAPLFGFVGRIVREKGVEELVDAWQTVRQGLPEARLLFVGEAEGHDAISPAYRECLEADPRVILHCFTEDTPALYSAMDVVLLPSYREGFPNVPLEAASMERPVISTDVPGCRDAVLDGVTGLLVPVGDAGALATAMLRYGRDAELRRAHGSAGRQRVLAKFLRERLWEAIADVYANASARRQAPSLAETDVTRPRRACRG